MPGTFTFDTTLPPKLDINVGAKSHFFQPPNTLSASGSLQRSRHSLHSHDRRPSTASKRKRSEDELYPQSHPSMESSTLSLNSEAYSKMTMSMNMNAESPQPLVNTHYRLAGGLDTPTAAARGVDYHDHQASTMTQLQNGRWLRPIDMPEVDEYFTSDHGVLARERNGHARILTSPKTKDGGIGKTVYTVAGKVWDLCRTNAFKGFFAGGGQGYELQNGPSCYREGEEGNWQDETREKDSRSSWLDKREDDDDYYGLNTPVPGRFPDEDFIPDYMSFDHKYLVTPQQTERAPKRVQREQEVDDETLPGMSASWMVVSHTSRSTRNSASPTRNRNSSPTPRSPVRKNASSTMGASHRKSASSASTRPARPSLHRNHHRSSMSLTNAGASASASATATASFASPRSPSSSFSSSALPTTTNTHAPSTPKHSRTRLSGDDSPLSEEINRHAARLRRREVEDDANLQRFNRQLKAMIREGKEALGTTVEVEVFDDR